MFYNKFYRIDTPNIFIYASSLICGILWAQTFIYSYFCLCLFLIFLFCKNNLKVFLFALAFFALGAFRITSFKNSHKIVAHKLKSKFVAVEGIIYDKATDKNIPDWFVYRLKVKQINSKKSNFLDPNYLIIHAQCKELEIGDKIKIFNLKSNKTKNKDFLLYQMKEGIIATCFLKKINYFKFAEKYFNLEIWLIKKRAALMEKLRNNIDGISYSLFSTIFLGNKISDYNEQEAIKIEFNLWGISHQLARSGLHVIILCIILNFLFGFLPIHLFLKNILATITLCIYMMLSWASISFIRAITIFLIYQFYIFSYKRINSLEGIAIATFIILLLNPLQIFFLDFQLSFGLTFLISLINQINKQRKITQ